MTSGLDTEQEPFTCTACGSHSVYYTAGAIEPKCMRCRAGVTPMFTPEDAEAVATLLRHPDHWPSSPYIEAAGDVLVDGFEDDTLNAAKQIIALLKRRLESR
jgi:hypothetical protein